MADDDARAFLGHGWAFPVAPGLRGDVAMAAYEEDVRQAVRLILGTERGSRVMRPSWGSSLHELTFEPINRTTLSLVRHRTEEALVLWEPRIDHVEVTVTAEPALGRLMIRVDYRVRSTNTFYNLVYPFYLMEARER